MIENTEILIRLVMSTIAGGIIGLEREVVHKPAGVRTHMLVCLGSTLFTLITLELLPAEAARLFAGVATGVGFLGAGTIFKSDKDIQGLTTAASIWTTAALGLTIGSGFYFMTAIVVILVLIILHLNKFKFFRTL